MTTETMTIRQMCEAYDVTPRTLRFYEQKELLAPIREGTRRLFTRRDRARLRLILRGKRFGFSLEDIRQLLDLYEVDPTQRRQLTEALAAARTRLREMRRQHDELGEAITDLEGHIARGEDDLAGLEANAA
jgi:DNA-binding transcriptional MerR regulator